MLPRRAPALVLTALFAAPACGTYHDTTECTDPSLPDDCTNPEVRASLGAQTSGTKTLRVRARIARNADGEPVVGYYRPWYDLITLNEAFSSSGIRFLLVDVEELPPDDALYDLDVSDVNPLCKGELKDLSADAIPLLYVSTLTTDDGPAGGGGNRCGAIVARNNSYAYLHGINGDFTAPEVIAHEVGHVLGLQHTHECIESLACPDAPEHSGDTIADTPFDPGPAGVSSLLCGGEQIEGQCTLVDSAWCAVECADGSTPDVRNFMSYYGGCADRFSAGQSVHMRCDVEVVHPDARCDNEWALGFGEEGYWSSWHVADVDGDGKADAVLHYGVPYNGIWRVALSTGTSFGQGAVWLEEHGTEAPVVLTGDVNGDGRADAVAFAGGTWSVALSTGTSFAAPSVWIEQHPTNAPEWWPDPLLGDVNGDGKADAVYFDDTTASWSVSLSTGDSFSTPVVWIEGFGGGSEEQLLADVDGDGDADAAAFSIQDDPNGSWDDAFSIWQVASSTGSGFAPPLQWYKGFGVDSYRRRLADVDGDGKADIVYYYLDITAWFVALSTGAGFGEAKLWMTGLGAGLVPGSGSGSSTRNGDGDMADVDGDGKADAVAVDDLRERWTTSLCR